MWGKTVFWLRLAAVLWVAAIGVVATLQALGLVPSLPKLSPYVWVISLVVLAIDNAGSLISRAFNKNRRVKQDDIEDALMGLLIKIARDHPELRFEDLGASVYRGPKRKARHSADVVPLHRVTRFRPAKYPAQSGISWTSTTGAVGECWRSRRTIYKLLHPIAAKWEGVEVTEEQFNKISAPARHGFTRDQFVAIAGKYSEVVAVPIWHAGKDKTLLGVLTIDRAFRGRDDNFKASLERTRDDAETTASVVSRTLVPSSSD